MNSTEDLYIKGTLKLVFTHPWLGEDEEVT